MGLISKVIGVGLIVGAFYAGRNMFPNCNTQNITPAERTGATVSCPASAEIPFEGLDAITGILGPDTTQIHYLTSTKSNRRGYLLQSTGAGEQGILVENTFTRKPMYIPLEQRISVPSSSVPSATYHSQPHTQAQPTLWERLTRETVDYFRR